MTTISYKPTHLKSSNSSIFELGETEIEIKDSLECLKLKIENINKIVNKTNLNLQDEKKNSKEIKFLSDQCIQIIKNLNLLISKHIIDHQDSSNDDDGATTTTKFNNNNNNFKNIELPIKDGFNYEFKELIQEFYKIIYFYNLKLTNVLFEMYRIIKSDLTDKEIENALKDSSPDQIFFKTSFGFSDFSENAKTALVYIQYRHFDLKLFNSILQEIKLITKIELFKINWNDIINTKIIFISPNLTSSSSSNNKKNNIKEMGCEEDDDNDDVKLFKNKLKKSTNSTKRFLIFNIWCCGNN